MAYTLSGNTINDITVYLTQLGKERLLTGTNFTIKRFGLGDSDTNYLDSIIIPMGLVPDICGDNLGCINSLSSGSNIKNFIEKDKILKPVAYFQYADNLSENDNSSFSMKVVLSKTFNKNIYFNFKLETILENPAFSNLLNKIEIVKNEVVLETFLNITDFNNYNYLLPINNLETNIIRFRFSNKLILKDVSREINIKLNILPNNYFLLSDTKILSRKNIVTVTPNILNVIPVLTNGRYNFDVSLEGLTYSYPLKFKIVGIPSLADDISYTNSYLMTNNNLGYAGGNYTIIVEDIYGSFNTFTVETDLQLTAQLEQINDSFKITEFGGSNFFSYKIFKVGTPIAIAKGNANNSNTILVNRAITSGNYYVEITDSNVVAISTTLNVLVSSINPFISINDLFLPAITVDVTNVTQLGNHTLTIFKSNDNVVFTLFKTVTQNFIGNYQFSSNIVPNYYYKIKLRTSYTVDSNDILFDYFDLGINKTVSNDIQNTGCFSLGTKIRLENNSLKLIKDINIGDRLKSFSFNDNYISSDNIQEYMLWNSNTLDLTEETTLVIGKTNKTLNYHYELNGADLSFDHPMLISRDNVFMFLIAKDIKVGDYLIDDKGNKVLVEKNVRKNIKLNVISLDVEPFNLYVANNYITHNNIGVDTGILDGV